MANTFVISVNGMTGYEGGDLGSAIPVPIGENDYMISGGLDTRHRAVIIDANDIHMNGESGTTLAQQLLYIDSIMKIAEVCEAMGADDYLMKLGAAFDPN